MRRWIRRALWIVFAVSSVTALVQVTRVGYAFAVMFGAFDPALIAEYRLKTADEAAYIAAIRDEIDAGNYAVAESLVALASENGHEIPEELVAAAEATTARRIMVSGGKLARGFAFGSTYSGEEIVGTVVSDLLVVGDIRDVAVQGKRMAFDEDYDPVILGLATVGIITSGGVLVTAGASATVDAGVAVVKGVYKAGRLSKPMLKTISRSANRVIDPQAFKAMSAGIDLRHLPGGKEFRTSLKTVVRQDEAAKLTALAADAGTIAGKGGARAAAMALELSDDAGDLTKLRRVATAFADNTVAVFKIAGKGLLRIADILFQIASALLSMLSSALLLVLRLFRIL
jgi:hypothetical protein